MERISLGALIIALCMLTDNAIVVTEGIKVESKSGEDKIQRDSRCDLAEPVAAVRSDRHRGRRLRGHRTVGRPHRRVLQFAVLGHSHFPGLSWVAAITFTPLLGYLMFKPKRPTAEAERDPYGGFLFRIYRRFLVAALRLRWAVLVCDGRAVWRRALRLPHSRSELFPARDPAAIHGG